MFANFFMEGPLKIVSINFSIRLFFNWWTLFTCNRLKTLNKTLVPIPFLTQELEMGHKPGLELISPVACFKE